MDNKKLLKILLNDLNELDELVSEKKNSDFDALEMEFVQTRIGGAKKLLQILYDNEISLQKEVVQKQKTEEPWKIIGKPKVEINTLNKPVENKVQEEVDEKEIQPEESAENVVAEISEEIDDSASNEPEKEMETEIKIEEPIVPDEAKIEHAPKNLIEKEVELNKKEQIIDEANHRLGDRFIKEKSVNDLMGADHSKLEHKLSNRPVANIQAAIGINDRFQYIRELFDGKAAVFADAVVELDSKKDIKEAVEYLQQNFKWQKNETSLKFINLVKRRFSHE